MTCGRQRALSSKSEQRPYGSIPYKHSCDDRVMKLSVLQAPSPLVLSFLRAQVKNAFESQTAQCAGATRQHRAYTLKDRDPWEAQTSRRRCMTAAHIGDWHTRRAFEQHGEIIPPTNKPAHHRTAARLYTPTVTRRAFSTSRPHNVWDMFKSARQRKLALQTPAHTTGEDSPGSAGSSLGRMLRPTNELKMRCTELDEHGNVTLVSGEFKKSELIAKYGLLPRDLRKIDSSLLPHILVRPSAILINLLNLRVLLKHNRVLVFDAYGTTDSKSQSVFMYDLDLKLRQKESPANGTLAYEFRALEAVLISVTLSLEKEFEGVSEPVVRVLRELEEDIDRDKLRYLLIYSKKLGSFEQKARLVRNALEELLEADDDLSAMYLTEKAEGKTREDEDHTEVEMLLESYHKVSDEIVQAAENLVSSIRNTEEMYVPNPFSSHSSIFPERSNANPPSTASKPSSTPTATPSCSWTSNSPSSPSQSQQAPSSPPSTA
jgi:magnesium transporter